jgi:hypothetical protein
LIIPLLQIDSNAARAQLRDIFAFASPTAERFRRKRELPRGPAHRAWFRHAVDVGEDDAIGTLDMQEHLLGTGFASGALHDPYLALLHEIAVLHDAIERLDLERRVEQAVPLRRIKRNAMVKTVNLQISDVTHPKFAAQTLKKTTELNWHPAQFLVGPTNSVAGVLKPAGLENVQGVFTTQFTKQVGDPAWANDPKSRNMSHS